MASSVTAGVGVIGSGNPAVLISIADSGQTLNYMSLINRKNAGSFDKTTKGMGKSHPSNLIGNPAKRWFMESQKEEGNATALRNLAATGTTSPSSKLIAGSGKMFSSGYTPYFLVNAFSLLLIHAGFWVLGFLAALVKRCVRGFAENSIAEKIYYILHWNLLIIIILLTTCEMTLLCFFQF